MPHIECASKIIKDYTAIFVFDDGRIGSGTFVSVRGFAGILTAHHVAEHLFEFKEFALCVADYPHGLWVRSELLVHVPIGPVLKNSAPEDGPDLSLLIIRDRTLVEAIQSEKLFYALDFVDLSFFRSPLSPKIWGVAGSPHDSFKRIEQDYQGGPLSKLLNFVGTGVFQYQTRQTDFDYIRLTVPSGEFEFPYHYEGMSGGGFWLIPMEIDPGGDVKTIGHRLPLLTGVEFHQSVRTNRERTLTGHGFASIYCRLMQTLTRARGAQSHCPATYPARHRV